MFFSHDEHWSASMRGAVKRAVDSGTSGGRRADRLMSCYKCPPDRSRNAYGALSDEEANRMRNTSVWQAENGTIIFVAGSRDWPAALGRGAASTPASNTPPAIC